MSNEEENQTETESVAEKAVKIAQSKLGMHEEGGENRGPIVEWGMAPWSKAEVGSWAKWCAAFVCTCLLEAGSKEIRKVASTSCDTLWNRCEKAGYSWINLKMIMERELQVGDLVFYGNSKDLYHVGMITDVQDGTLIVIEGNDNDAVRESVHDVTEKSIFGFARIP